MLSTTSIQLAICSPYDTETVLSGKEKNGLSYYVVPNNYENFDEIIADFQPDILHVFETESPQALKLVKAFHNRERTVINIQGMLNIYADTYFDGLPVNLKKRQRLFEGYIHNGLIDQCNQMRQRSKIENEMLKNVDHVIGRTDIDNMFSMYHNRNIQYHHCNEILRAEFSNPGGWDVANVSRHSILFRSTNSPIKGLHMLLQAMVELVKVFPDVHLNVIGPDLFYPCSLKGCFVESSYNRYIRKMIFENCLENHITFLGTLTASQMYKTYMKAHVFVSASQIENESNTISEAKILGVPCVSSFVGGLSNRITHGKDGFLYQFNLPTMLAYYVRRIFEDDNLAAKLSSNAVASQTEINDPSINLQTLLQIYEKICNGK